MQEQGKGEKLTQVIGTLIGLISIPLLIGVGMNYRDKKAEKYPWSVSFYTGERLTDSKLSKFKTVEECRKWAQDKAKSLNLEEGEWDYECGRGCTYTDQAIEGGRQVQTFTCVEIIK